MRGWVRARRKIVGAAFLTALSLAASASSATASVTIGQLVPAAVGCAPNNDWAQLSVGSGTPYVVPGNGTITSWSHSAGAGAGQTMTMKIWRQVVAGTTYTAVGHDGPRALAPSAINTFSANIPVRPGDILGFHSGALAPAACLSAIIPGDTLLGRGGDAADGEPADFTPFSRHLNITAVFEPAKPEPAMPSNSLTLGKVKRNTKKGTATITVNVPNPGELTGSGKGAKVARASGAVTSKAVSAGNAQLLIKAKGKKKRKLNKRGKVKLKVAITYTPTGGAPNTQSRKLKLKKR